LQVNYWTKVALDGLKKSTKSFHQRSKEKMASFLVSKCNRNIPAFHLSREGLAQVINEHIGVSIIILLTIVVNYYSKVDSFGNCWNNKNTTEKCQTLYEPSMKSNAKNYKVKVCLLEDYKFHFAFENIEEPYYITEKSGDALRAGTIPIYSGAPNIENYLPKNSFLKLSDFKSVDALVAEMKRIGSNEKIWNSFQAWRNDKTDPFWKRIVSHSMPEWPCNLCYFLKHGKYRASLS
jgi:hypothetical protein